MLLNKLDAENAEVKYPQLLSKYSQAQNKPLLRVFAQIWPDNRIPAQN